MFLSFVKKDASELEVVAKIRGKYKTLPFDIILRLLLIYKTIGLKELNLKIDEFANKITNQSLSNYCDSYGNEEQDLYFNITKVLPFYEHFYFRDDLKNLLIKDALHFVFAIKQNTLGLFDTKVNDIFDVQKNLHISIAWIIQEQDAVFAHLPNHINLSSNNFDQIVEFSNLSNLKIQIINTIILDAAREKKYKFVFNENYKKSFPDVTSELEKTTKYKTESGQVTETTSASAPGSQDAILPDGSIYDYKTVEKP